MSRLGATLSRHRRVAVITAVVLAIGLITFVTIRAGTRNDDLVPAVEASTTVPLQGARGEFLRLFDQGREASYSATYRQTGPAGESTVRLARRPPEERLETESGAGEEVKRSANVVMARERVVCTQDRNGPWSCSRQPGRGTGAFTEVVSASIVSQISAFEVEARDEQVGGQAVRCFTFSGPQGPPAEMCLTREGILARVVAGDTRLELTALNRAAPPDSAFVPPAQPSG
jgi:hypothetical protein